MKNNWMAELASHYERIRGLYSQDKLMLLFDIDGTILDMRYMVLCVLKAYDVKLETHFFQKLEASDIKLHENQMGELLKETQIPY
ncbi:MAG: hypothetical protein MRK01_16285 [Candidatus Scalindua sp.]|nr:hypothetical protein [Candidatus Scalindua sp.]